ncbi:antitoxin MazE-like protein [Glacieibacterium sp.]|uniref:antitoxin MazE-like protein n=1 Tax=Glacieibacterium sp. TaxID=2860237 RepID=UPI003B005100
MNEHIAPSRFRRYRGGRRVAGLREVRLWVPDISSPAFIEQLARESALIDAAPDDEWQSIVDAELATLDEWASPETRSLPADEAR